MENTYLHLLNSKGYEDFRNIILTKDFEEYRKNLKKLVTLQKRLKNIDNNIIGPTDKIDAFHHLFIHSYYNRKPKMKFNLVNNTVAFYQKDISYSRIREERSVEVCKFNLDKLKLFNEASLFTIRNLYLEKLNTYKQKKHINVEFEDDLLERFIILLVSNYQFILYANGNIENAIANYKIIKKIIEFTKDNESIKNETLEEFVKAFYENVISNDDIYIIHNLHLETPSLDGLKEIVDIQKTCLNSCYDKLKKEPNYEFLVNEFLELSRYVLEYEKKLKN